MESLPPNCQGIPSKSYTLANTSDFWTESQWSRSEVSVHSRMTGVRVCRPLSLERKLHLRSPRELFPMGSWPWGSFQGIFKSLVSCCLLLCLQLWVALVGLLPVVRSDWLCQLSVPWLTWTTEKERTGLTWFSPWPSTPVTSRTFTWKCPQSLGKTLRWERGCPGNTSGLNTPNAWQ